MERDEAIIVHQIRVKEAVLALARAMVPDGQYDPSEAWRAEVPFAILRELVGETSARGIQEALGLLVVEWKAGQ